MGLLQGVHVVFPPGVLCAFDVMGSLERMRGVCMLLVAILQQSSKGFRKVTGYFRERNDESSYMGD